MTENQRVLALEEALEIWSRAWANSVTQWGMDRAESQILKITRQLEALKNEVA